MPPPSLGIITCPLCTYQASAPIPDQACLSSFDCPGCGSRLRPLPGDCCVFCSYGDRPCPYRGDAQK